MPFPPVEPTPSSVQFPDARRAGDHEIVAIGVDFSPGTLLKAYRNGIFPWPHSHELVPWCSPDPRALFPLETYPFQWSRSLRRALHNHTFEVTFDTAFSEVMQACGEGRDEGTWITPDMIDGYTQLHQLGWAHSLEVWESNREERVLVGGIYGVQIGAYFAGESMFYRRTNASKIAFATLAETLRANGFLLFDVQVMNDHLASLGCIEIRRSEFFDRLKQSIQQPTRFPQQPILFNRKTSQ